MIAAALAFVGTLVVLFVAGGALFYVASWLIAEAVRMGIA